VFGIDGIVRWRDRLAFACDLGSHTLRKLANRLLVDQKIRLRLTEHIDKTRHDDEASSIDGALSGDRRVSFSDKSDSVGDDPDVGVDPWISRAIYDPAVTDEHIVLLCEETASAGHNQQQKGQLDSRQGELR
jgi:hypothetical protein